MFIKLVTKKCGDWSAAFFKTPAVLGVDGVGVAGPLTSTSYFCFSPLDFTTVAISPLKTCH